MALKKKPIEEIVFLSSDAAARARLQSIPGAPEVGVVLVEGETEKSQGENEKSPTKEPRNSPIEN